MNTDNSLADFFFMDTELGKLFSVYRNSLSGKPYKGEIVYIHSFCDEMNKTRRMAATQASELSKLGYGVLQIDLYGCGDSDGEFEEANWEIWLDNIDSAIKWLNSKQKFNISYWGLRLGTLLILDYIGQKKKENCKVILWQPVISGKIFVKQFLRIVHSDNTGQIRTASQIRKEFDQGKTVEIAGYKINAKLFKAINKLKIDEQIENAKIDRIEWFEVNALGGDQLNFASQKMIENIIDDEVQLNTYVLAGQPYWATTEITFIDELIQLTTSAISTW